MKYHHQFSSVKGKLTTGATKQTKGASQIADLPRGFLTRPIASGNSSNFLFP